MADLLERARRLGHETFAPIAEQGEPGRLNRPLVKALGDEGLLELALTGTALELCELREGLAHGCTEAETRLLLEVCAVARLLAVDEAAGGLVPTERFDAWRLEDAPARLRVLLAGGPSIDTAATAESVRLALVRVGVVDVPVRVDLVDAIPRTALGKAPLVRRQPLLEGVTVAQAGQVVEVRPLL